MVARGTRCACAHGMEERRGHVSGDESAAFVITGDRVASEPSGIAQRLLRWEWCVGMRFSGAAVAVLGALLLFGCGRSAADNRSVTASSQGCTPLRTVEEVYAAAYDAYVPGAGTPTAPDQNVLLSTPVQWCANTSSWSAGDQALYAKVHAAYSAVVAHHLVGARTVFRMRGFTWLCRQTTNRTGTGAGAFLWARGWGAPPQQSGTCGLRLGS